MELANTCLPSQGMSGADGHPTEGDRSRCVTVVVWYKANTDPLRFSTPVLNFPEFALATYSRFLLPELELNSNSPLDHYNNRICRWVRTTPLVPRFVDGGQLLFYKFMGLTEAECPGLQLELSWPGHFDPMLVETSCPQPVLKRKRSTDDLSGPPKRIPSLEKLIAFCHDSNKIKTKSFKSKEGEVEYLKFEDEAWDMIRDCFYCPKNLIIRNEYREALNYLNTSTKNVYITGQSGIGKSAFLVYITITQIRNGHPVAFRAPDGEYYLITNERAYRLTSGLSLPDLPKVVWALSDTDNFDADTARLFREYKFRVIHVTSPCSKHIKRWIDILDGVPWTMDIWPGIEMSALAFVRSDIPAETLLSLAEKYGNSPGAILRLALHPWEERSFLWKLTAGAETLVEDPWIFICDVQTLRVLDSATASALFLRPVVDDKGTHREKLVATLPSEYIARLITEVLAQKDAAVQAEFFDRASYYPLGRTLAGWMHDHIVHTTFTTSTHIPCTWYRSGATPPQSILGVQPQEALQADGDLRNAQPPFYWRPKTKKSSGIDAVLCNSQGVFMIRLTTSSGQETLVTAIQEFREGRCNAAIVMGLPEYLIFVGSNEERCRLLCKQAAEEMRRDEWENVPIGYCNIVMDRSITDLLEG